MWNKNILACWLVCLVVEEPLYTVHDTTVLPEQLPHCSICSGTCSKQALSLLLSASFIICSQTPFYFYAKTIWQLRFY